MAILFSKFKSIDGRIEYWGDRIRVYELIERVCDLRSRPAVLKRCWFDKAGSYDITELHWKRTLPFHSLRSGVHFSEMIAVR